MPAHFQQLSDAMLFDSFRIALNRYETNRIFIAFISESIEKFTALEILSGTLQFTCAWQEYTHTDSDSDSQPDIDRESTGSRQRVESGVSSAKQEAGRRQKGGLAPNFKECQQFILLPANFSRNVPFHFVFPFGRKIFGMQRSKGGTV